MGYELKQSIRLKQLIEKTKLNHLHYNKDILITNIASFDQIKEGSLSFSKTVDKQDIECAILINNQEIKEHVNFIYSRNTRLDFVQLLDYLNTEIGFSHFDFEAEIHPTVQIGENVVIEKGCKISENVILEHNVVIQSGTTIGKNSRIRANSSVGGDGFGFERLEDGKPIRFPHIGGVEIGENVEIGSNTCIVRGVLSNTIIHNNVKIDNLVHIAHNCIIDNGAFVIAGAEVSGSVHIEENAWIGPNACILQKVTIGKNALVGLGAVVTKSIPENTIYAGNPAKYIRDIN